MADIASVGRFLIVVVGVLFNVRMSPRQAPLIGSADLLGSSSDGAVKEVCLAQVAQ